MSLATEIAGKLNYLNIQDKNTINALAPYSGYMKVSKKLDNFVFQTSSSFLNKVADKNRFAKFGDKVVDTYGPELVTNGDFSNGTAGWTSQSTASILWTLNGIQISRGGASFVDQAAAPISLIAGRSYIVSLSVIAPPSSGTASLGIFASNRITERTIPGTVSITKAQSYSFVFNATVTEVGYVIAGTAGNETGISIFDNISVREIKTADFTNTVPDVAEVITNGSNTTSVAVNAGDYVVDCSELVTNGTFDSDISGWSIGSGTTTEVINGEVKVTAGSVYGIYKELSGLIIGQKYILRGSGRVSVGGDVRLRYYPDTFNVGTYIDSNVVTSTSNKEMSLTFIAESTSPVIYLRCSATAIVGYFDNISVKRVSDTFRATRDTADMYDVAVEIGQTFSVVAGQICKFGVGFDNATEGHYYKRLGTSLINYTPQSNMNVPASDWQDLGTASNMSLSNKYFEDRTQIGVTNQALAYHAYNTLTNSYEGIKTEVLFSDVSKEDLLDNSVWMARNGFSKVSEFLYSKGVYQVLPVGIWQSLNKGAYHPFLNPFGTSIIWKSNGEVSGVYWHITIAKVLSTVANCFDTSIGINTSGEVSPFVRGDRGMVSSGVTGRPSSVSYLGGEFYDIIYPDQFIDVREYAKIVNRDEVKLLVDDKEQWGVEESVKTIRANGGINSSFFRGYWAAITPTALALHYSTDIGMPISDSDAILKYKTWNCVVIQGQVYIGKVTGVVIAGDSHLIFTCLENHNLNQGYWGTDAEVIATTTKPILSSGTKLSIDLIGDPATSYPQVLKDRLASGVGVVGVNPLLVSDEGASMLPIDTNVFKCNDKAIKWLSSVWNNAGTLENSTKLNDLLTNNNNSGSASTLLDNEYLIVNYTSKNKPYIQSNPLPVIDVEPKVVASNSNSLYMGALIGNQVSGKIQVGNGANGYESKVLENIESYSITYSKIVYPNESVSILEGTIFLNMVDGFIMQRTAGGTWSGTWTSTSTAQEGSTNWTVISRIPQHPTLALDNANGPASKWFKAVSQGTNGVVGSVYGKEMVWDYAMDNRNEFTDILGTASQSSIISGNYYNITTGFFVGYYQAKIAAPTNNSFDVTMFNIGSDGSLYIDTVLWYQRWDGNGFGDNNKFDQLTNSTKTDLNGNTVRCFVGHIPINAMIK